MGTRDRIAVLMDDPGEKLIRQQQEVIRQQQEVIARQHALIEELRAKVKQLERRIEQLESGRGKRKGMPGNKVEASEPPSQEGACGEAAQEEEGGRIRAAAWGADAPGGARGG